MRAPAPVPPRGARAANRLRARRNNTISQAKNRMQRAVNEIVDPGPTNLDPVWDHFEARCAYCGKELNRSAHEGHVDHAISSGGNHLGNLVLACASCNGDEKREQPWREFLVKKAPDPVVFGDREERIRRWLDRHSRPLLEEAPEIAKARADAEDVIVLFASKCNALKLLVRQRAARDE
jgi:HNH endonuclease